MYSGKWHRVTWKRYIKFSEKSSTSIFKYLILWGARRFLHNTGMYLSNNTASHPQKSNFNSDRCENLNLIQRHYGYVFNIKSTNSQRNYLHGAESLVRNKNLLIWWRNSPPFWNRKSTALFKWTHLGYTIMVHAAISSRRTLIFVYMITSQFLILTKLTPTKMEVQTGVQISIYSYHVIMFYFLLM